MKKLLLFILTFFIPFSINAATTSNYYIEANVKENGDMEIKELKVLEGEYNGLLTNLRFKDSTIQNFSGILDDFEGSDIYNATALESVKVYAVPQSNLSFDNILERATLFENVKSAEVGEYGKYTSMIIPSGVNLTIYMPSSNMKASLVTYTLKNAVVMHNDIAEIAWDFIGDYEDDITDLQITINLPADSEELRVFSHGPLQGYNEIASKSTVKVTYPNINAYEKIDVRVVFDKSLVPNATKLSNIDGLENILTVEKNRAEKANEQRESVKKTYNILLYSYIAYIVGAIIIFIKYYIKYDKEIKSDFKLDYYRDFIDDYDVEVVDYLFNRSITSNAMSASIMNLIYKKNILAEKTLDKKNDFTFTLKNRDKASPEENDLLNLLFDEVGDGKTFTTNQLKKYARISSSDFLSKYETWKNAVIKVSKAQEFFENNNKHKILGALYAVLGGFLFAIDKYYETDIWLGKSLIFVAIILFVYILSFSKKTKKGVDHYAKWKAFKKFLLDFGNFKEKELPEIILWERYLVYATVFGIADKVEKAMSVKIKEIDPTGTRYSTNYFPMYSLNMNRTISHAIDSSVRQSINSAVASSRSSSSGGFGGGSSFGGGGFGGGGSGGGRF